MKTLLIMRHAKSSWKDAELPDQERPLNKRGKHDAPMMGELIKDKELRPQVIYASTAKRARMTAEEVSSACKFKGDVTYLDNLYLAEAEAILDVLHTTPDEIERVLIIGHNPGLEGLLQMLSHRVESLPTAAIQTGASFRRDDEETKDKPFQLDRCHALETSAEAVRIYYPRWYRKPSMPS